MALGWLAIQGLNVDVVATEYCKFQERRNGGLQNRLLGQNKIKDYSKKGCRPIYTDYRPLPAGLSKQVKGLQ